MNNLPLERAPNGAPKRRSESLSQEAFDLLLSRLDADRERAGEKYILLRLRLTTYFQAKRCVAAEALADDTLNRVARKIAEGEEPHNLTAYCYGFARFVLLEYLKKPQAEQEDDDHPAQVNPQIDDEIERKEKRAIFSRCLRELPNDEALLFLEYWYHDDLSNREARHQMAERLGLSPTALRIRIHRIRAKIESCLGKFRRKNS